MEKKKKENKKTTERDVKAQIIELFMAKPKISAEEVAKNLKCSEVCAKEVLRTIWQEPAVRDNPPLGFVSGTNIPRMREKVSILGFAPSTMRDVRHVWDDPDMEVWGINQLYMPGAFPEIVEHATRWFQIHHRSSYDQTTERDITHHEWLSRQTTFPIYMQKREPDIPMSVPFPKDEILKHYRRYFTNTITWMIVLAHFEGFKEVHLYGIDMAQDSEYSYERPSVEWAVGMFDGCPDRTIIVPEKSDICKSTFLYPFDDTAPIRTKIHGRRLELRERLNAAAAQEADGRDARMQFIGALDNLNYIEKCWWFNSSKIEMPPDNKGK